MQVHVASQHRARVLEWPEILSPASQKSALAEVHLYAARLPLRAGQHPSGSRHRQSELVSAC